MWLEAGGHDGGGGAAVVIIGVGCQLPGWSTASEHLNINLVNARYCDIINHYSIVKIFGA